MIWWRLVSRRLASEWKTAMTLSACLGIAVFLPLITRLLIATYEDELRDRGSATPLVAGTRGNRFDLVLGALYFRPLQPEFITLQTCYDFKTSIRGTVVPLHLGFTVRSSPLVATTHEYFEARKLRVQKGTLPLVLGDVILGHSLASDLALGSGDHITSDQLELYDLSVPPALRMHVSGVLQKTGTADDAAAFIDLATAWIIEGRAHGHDDILSGVGDSPLTVTHLDGQAFVSPGITEYHEITPGNMTAFHVHGDTMTFPISAALIFPADDKESTLLKARFNTTGGLIQVLAPGDVIDDLLAFVFRIRSLVDAVSLVLMGTTMALAGLITVLSVRMRKRERQTLHRIGCAPSMVIRLIAAELVTTAAAGILGAVFLAVLIRSLLPGLVQYL